MLLRPAAALAGLFLAATLTAAPPAAADTKARPLPGFAGLSYRELTPKHACRSPIRIVTRSRKVDDPELVTLLTWPRLTGLDFDPDDTARQRTSVRRFQAWLQKLMAQARKVDERQVAIVRDPGRAALTRVEAAARLVVAREQVVSLIGGLDMPSSVRTFPEAADAFCDVLLEQVEPLEQQVVEARDSCRWLITDTDVGDGWWTAVCAAPAGAPPRILAPPPPSVAPPRP